jgi:hypothetical protein
MDGLYIRYRHNSTSQFPVNGWHRLLFSWFRGKSSDHSMLLIHQLAVYWQVKAEVWSDNSGVLCDRLINHRPALYFSVGAQLERNILHSPSASSHPQHSPLGVSDRDAQIPYKEKLKADPQGLKSDRQG